ncbi:MAG: hypothetical protein P0Y59_18895 [Candidatus Sphingomonas phytovorans]|nr:hypothetical protein [Sphingomonas sp.]WEJ98989.1 MAG: hypothetical protein P0Y59_18895 [Sphingomonas sp.]
MSGSDSLSGEWDGIFNYPSHLPPKTFTAVLREEDGALTGETTESSEARLDPSILHAWLEGRRSAGSVRFVKSYDASSRAHYVVHYTGTIASDANEITGQWHVPGAWSGTFIMVRRAAKTESIERKVAETIR